MAKRRSDSSSSGEPAVPTQPRDPANEHALDRQLIAALQEDGRLTNMALGRRLGVSEAAVRQRLKRLYENRSLRSAAIADPRVMGLGHVAMVRIAVAPDALPLALEKLKQLANFRYIAVATGDFNIVAFSLTQDAAALARTLDEHVRPNVYTRRIDVRAVVSATKYEADSAFM